MADALRIKLTGRTILVLVFGFLYLPIAVLVLLSFNESGLPTSWSASRCTGTCRWPAIQRHSSCGLEHVGCGRCRDADRHRSRHHAGARHGNAQAPFERALEALAFAPMVIPDIVLAVALLTLFSRLNITMGLHTIIISHVIFDLAFVCSVVRARLKNFDFSIVEASRDLGASSCTTFWRITFPVHAAGHHCRRAARLHAVGR